jgi:hypothetical protein
MCSSAAGVLPRWRTSLPDARTLTPVKTTRRAKAVAVNYVFPTTPLGAPRAPISTSVHAFQKVHTRWRLRLHVVLVRFVWDPKTPQFLHRAAKNLWANIFPRLPEPSPARFLSSDAQRYAAPVARPLRTSLTSKSVPRDGEQRAGCFRKRRMTPFAATRWFQNHSGRYRMEYETRVLYKLRESWPKLDSSVA